MSATAQKSVSPSDAKRCVQSLRRRLSHWELQHLRTLAADLHAKLEEAERRADQAEDQARFWWDTAMRLQEDLEADNAGTAIGLTQDGALVVLRDGVPA